MPRLIETKPSVNLQQMLYRLTVDSLKALVTLLPAKTKPTRKAELVNLVESYLQGEKLHRLWQQLDSIQQSAVAEAAYATGGIFDARRFKAKYGKLPGFATGKSVFGYLRQPNLLQLFIYSEEVVPADLIKRLQQFVAKPEAYKLPSTETLPNHIEWVKKLYEWDTDDDDTLFIVGDTAGKTHEQKAKANTQHIAITQRSTERDALVDFPMLLRFVDSGKMVVSNKTFQPSSATIKTLVELLSQHDFYEVKPKTNKWQQEIGAIKAFAWPLLLQAARLVELHGNKLALTKAGRSALNKPVAELLRLIWQRWLKTRLLDEFSRINVIKGQGGKGKRSMTEITGRRIQVAKALKECPVNRWIKVDDLWCFMQVADFDFEITHDPWDLYIAERQYGSLGYEDYHNWSVLQGRYVLCLLFEYLATLGMIDIAYTDPAGIRQDYQHMWGTDDLSFLSRYDGLHYIRLNPLGAYCLGISHEYTPAIVQVKTSIMVLPSLQIKVTGGPLSTDESLLLENYADAKAIDLWRLDRQKALAAVEKGHQIAELRQFLAARDEQPLPETVEAFITTTERQGQALRLQGTALLIECTDDRLADLIANNTAVKSWCQRAGKRHLVIPTQQEAAFRKAINKLGYGMPNLSC
jgi:hypothetical protein